MPRPRCAVLDDWQGVAAELADWSRVSRRVEVVFLREHLADEDAVVAALAGCEIVVAMRERTPLPARVLARLPALRLIVTTGMRNAAIDVAAAAARGIVVCGTGSRPEPPAELTWALILGLARRLAPEAAAMRAGGPWQRTVGLDLAGRTLGVVGLGKIGGRVARVGLAFGMEVLAWSANLDDARAAEVGARRVSRHELLERSDVVTVHLVLSERTRGLIGAEELARMRPDALLINTARAGIVDEDALVAALRAGRPGGAGLDVFAREPLPADHPLRTLPNVLATPHLGYVTRGNYSIYFTEAVEDIAAYLDGSPVRRL